MIQAVPKLITFATKKACTLLVVTPALAEGLLLTAHQGNQKVMRSGSVKHL